MEGPGNPGVFVNGTRFVIPIKVRTLGFLPREGALVRADDSWEWAPCPARLEVLPSGTILVLVYNVGER